MPAESRTLRVLLFSTLFASLIGLAAGQAPPPVPAKSVQSAASPAVHAPSPEDSKYVGAETCKTCHEEIYNAWEKTPHWKTTLNKAGGPSKQGCEGCHGPGADHVAGGGDKTKIYVFEGKSREQTSARCLSCHGEAHEQSHFAESAHASSDVGCLDCHSPHHAKESQHLLVQEQPQLCYGCHTSAKADLPNPFIIASTKGWCNATTAITLMERQRCGSYALCPAAMRFATSATSTSRAHSFTSTCRSRPRVAAVATRRTVPPIPVCSK